MTGAANDPKEDEGEENTAGNRMRLARDPVGGSHGREHENFPTSVPRTLGILGGAAGRLTKQATTLSEEINAPRSGTTAQELHRVLMGGNQMLHSTVGGGNGMGGATGTTAAPTAGQHQGAGRDSTGWSALKEAVKCFGPAATKQEFLEKLLKLQSDVGVGWGGQKSASHLK